MTSPGTGEVLGFVLTIRDGHPTTPLLLISPIFGSWRDQSHRPHRNAKFSI